MGLLVRLLNMDLPKLQSSFDSQDIRIDSPMRMSSAGLTLNCSRGDEVSLLFMVANYLSVHIQLYTTSSETTSPPEMDWLVGGMFRLPSGAALNLQN